MVFELLAYSGGFQLYRWLRRREGDVVSTPTRWSVVVAAAVGGALGSRLLAALEQPSQLTSHWLDVLLLSGGKTIVGGLIGGLIAVEWTKRRLGVTTRTGDLFAAPLAAGIAVGRVGCFLSGLDDGTFGTPTAMWSGIDFGDGIPRHPTQLYELAFLLVVAAALTPWSTRRQQSEPFREGDRFRLFMVGYMAFRLAVDALKPDPRLALGLSAIQWACIATLLYYLPDITRWLTTPALLRPQLRQHGPPGNKSAR